MNRRALIWHLIVKDLRYQRVLLALVWLLALLLPILARTVSPGRFGGDDFLSGPKELLALICAVIIIRSIQLDPPRRGIHFLAARPVDWISLLGSKFLFAAAFLLVPNLIATLGPMLAVGMHFDYLDLLLFLIEGTITAAALWSVVAAPALFLRKLASALLTIMGGAVLIGIALAIDLVYQFQTGTLFSSHPVEPSYPLDGCRWLIFKLGLACTGIAGALFCYNKRSLRMCLMHIASYSNIVDYNVCLPGGLKGLQAPYFFIQTGDNAEMALRSGRKYTSSYKSDREGKLLEAGERGDSLEAQLMGFTPAPGESKPWQDESFEAFHSLPDHYRDEDLNGVSIHGVATFGIGRAFLLGDLPLRNGMVLNQQRRHYTVEHVKASPTEISFQIVKRYMALTLRGDTPASEEWENLTLIVVNRRKGEYLTDHGAERHIDSSEMHQLKRPGDAKQPIPADWINDAEIVFFSSESCGQISFPYEVPSIDLVH